MEMKTLNNKMRKMEDEFLYARSTACAKRLRQLRKTNLQEYKKLSAKCTKIEFFGYVALILAAFAGILMMSAALFFICQQSGAPISQLQCNVGSIIFYVGFTFAMISSNPYDSHYTKDNMTTPF